MARLKRISFVFLLLWTVPSSWLRADTSSALQDYQAGRYHQAFQEFQAASHKGDIKALYYAGLMYTKGQGVPKDMGKALFCLRTAATKGSREAALTLADLYQRGDGVPRNEVEARRWATIAEKSVQVPHPQVITTSTVTLPSLQIQNSTNTTKPFIHRNLLMLILHSPRAALKVAPFLLILLAIPLSFLFLFLWMLTSGSNEPLQAPPSLSVRGFRSEEAISFGWRLVKRNAGFSVALCMLYVFLITAVHHATAYIPNMIASFLAFSIWVMFLDAVRLRIALDTFDNGIANASGIGEAASRFGSVILARLLYGFVSGIGMLFLIIPGIYLQCKYYFASWIVIDQGVDAMAAMERSSQLTEGIKFRIFIFRIVMYFFIVLGVLTLGFGLWLFWPITWFAEAYFYRSLQKRKVPLSARTRVPLFGISPLVWGSLALVGFMGIGFVAKRFPLSKANGYIDQLSVNNKINQIALGSLNKRKAELQTQKQAMYVIEWQRYKPIYDMAGMSEVWSMMDLGKCDEAEKQLQNPASYEKMDKILGAASRTATISQGLKICRDRFSTPV